MVEFIVVWDKETVGDVIEREVEIVVVEFSALKMLVVAGLRDVVMSLP